MRDGSGRPAQIPLSIVKPYPDPVTVMNGYDPNSDENWLKEYLVGQTTGGGWGTYGEIGNQAYRARQHREAEQRKQQQKWQQRTTRPVSAPVHTSPAVDPPIAAQPASTPEELEHHLCPFGLLGRRVCRLRSGRSQLGRAGLHRADHRIPRGALLQGPSVPRRCPACASALLRRIALESSGPLA